MATKARTVYVVVLDNFEGRGSQEYEANSEVVGVRLTCAGANKLLDKTYKKKGVDSTASDFDGGDLTFEVRIEEHEAS